MTQFFPWIAPLTLDWYLLMLRVKQGVIKYHFFVSQLWLELGLQPCLLNHCCLYAKQLNFFVANGKASSVNIFIPYSLHSFLSLSPPIYIYIYTYVYMHVWFIKTDVTVFTSTFMQNHFNFLIFMKTVDVYSCVNEESFQIISWMSGKVWEYKKGQTWTFVSLHSQTQIIKE